MKIYAATSNPNKLREIRGILAPSGVSAEPYPDYDRLSVEETGATFEENASIKALALSKITGEHVIADDSGLSVSALSGAPGVHSARYAGTGATDEMNNRLLLDNLAGHSRREASFVCAVALAKNGVVIKIFRGECAGRIAFQARGKGGFGYDPLFLLPDGRTMAELSADEKNAVSHRAQALRKLAVYLKRLVR